MNTPTTVFEDALTGAILKRINGYAPDNVNIITICDIDYKVISRNFNADTEELIITVLSNF